MLGDKIKYLRKKMGYTQEDLAKILRKKYGLRTDRVMISKWETGYQAPQMHTITCLADCFSVSVDYLNGSEAKLKQPNTTSDTVLFPVIGEIAAGYDNIALEDWSGETVEIPFSYLKGRKREDYFVLSVKGNSMYPKYINGDKVLILKQSTLNRSGDIGAIMYDDELATLKKVEYVMGEDWLRLVPINPEYEPKTIQGENLEHCRIIGIPKLLIREIDE